MAIASEILRTFSLDRIRMIHEPCMIHGSRSETGIIQAKQGYGKVPILGLFTDKGPAGASVKTIWSESQWK